MSCCLASYMLDFGSLALKHINWITVFIPYRIMIYSKGIQYCPCRSDFNHYSQLKHTLTHISERYRYKGFKESRSWEERQNLGTHTLELLQI